jgi:hypothetical protein
VIPKTLFLAVLLALPFSCQAASPLENARTPHGDTELRRWLENMVWYHRFTFDEIQAATGLPVETIQEALKRWQIEAETRPNRAEDASILVLPYPGGRHPRIGFLEGAIDPQRETKVSVFLPWEPTHYVVLDVPEAIWWDGPDGRELLYLAHTHIATHWDKKGITLKTLEWQTTPQGTLRCERSLPNGVAFGTEIQALQNAVRMEMWLTNGTQNTLSGLDVQNCIMMKGAPEFAQLDNENKVFRKPVAACRSNKAARWLITAWAPCHRVWGNPDCPCMHSDPKFPDCAPGETVRLRGWLSFFEGEEIAAEMERIARIVAQP